MQRGRRDGGDEDVCKEGEGTGLFIEVLAEAIFALVEDEELCDTAAVASTGEVVVDDVGSGAGVEAHALGGLFGGLLSDKLLPSEGDAFDGEGGAEDTGSFVFDLLAEVGVFVGVLVGDETARVGDEESDGFLSRELDVGEVHFGFGFSGRGGRTGVGFGASDGFRARGSRARGFDGFEGDVEFDGGGGADGDGAGTGEISGSSDGEAVCTDFDLLAVDGGITDQAAIEFNAASGGGIDENGAFFLDSGRIGAGGWCRFGRFDFGDLGGFGFSAFWGRASSPSFAAFAGGGFFGIIACFGRFGCDRFFAGVFFGFLNFLVPFADLVAAGVVHQEAFEQSQGVIVIFLTIKEFDTSEAGFQFDALLGVLEPRAKESSIGRILEIGEISAGFLKRAVDEKVVDFGLVFGL